MNNNPNFNPEDRSFRKQGVRLKRFEAVVTNILSSSVEPKYVRLGRKMGEERKGESDWPFNILPVAARVLGKGPGQLRNPKRAAKKEGQIRNILRVVLKLAPKDKNITIVDFGGGSGHLGIPLALLLPKATVCVVDLRKKSLDLMHEKASLVIGEVLQSNSSREGEQSSVVQPPFDENTNCDGAFQKVGTRGVLENLYTFHGPVEAFNVSFDMAIALHLCGEATDVAIRKAANRKASIVCAPCCVGKLSTKAINPDIYNATGYNDATVKYPQSLIFCQLIKSQNDWDALAKAADYSNESESRTHRNATRRTAKALLETDRRIFLEERYKYKTALLKMEPWELTPKNDIIVAWNPYRIQIEDSLFAESDVECSLDIAVAKSQLLAGDQDINAYDWTKEEERKITEKVQEFLDRTGAKDETLIFPTGMGPRKRKLIHFVATKMNLAHWCIGKKAYEKTVAVARHGKRKRKDG